MTLIDLEHARDALYQHLNEQAVFLAGSAVLVIWVIGLIMVNLTTRPNKPKKRKRKLAEFKR